MLVYNAMNPEPVTCCVDETLERVARLMWEEDVGFLPVVDRDGTLVGAVTDRDALMAAYTRGCALSDLRVDIAMCREPISCTIHDEVTAIEHRMAAHRVRRLPVVDPARKVIGVITLSDIARTSFRGHEVSPKGTAWALAAITERRRRTAS